MDAGFTWNPVNGQAGSPLATVLVNAGDIMLAMAPSSTSTLYATVQAKGSFGPVTPTANIFKTVDGGATWNAAASLSSYGNKGMVVTVHPTHPDIVFV